MKDQIGDDIDDKYAFPHIHRITEYDDSGMAHHQDTFVSGLTLRDYIAIKAMHATAGTNDGLSFDDRSHWSYRQADSMLKERAK